MGLMVTKDQEKNQLYYSEVRINVLRPTHGINTTCSEDEKSKKWIAIESNEHTHQ